MRRAGEEGRRYFRSDRLVRINEAWYFMSRGRTPDGPFKARKGAIDAMQRYVAIVSDEYFSTLELEHINAMDV